MPVEEPGKEVEGSDMDAACVAIFYLTGV